MPTFHIPQKAEKCPTSEVKISQGYPGLPNGLLWMTSSLIHNYKPNAKMALKEVRNPPPSRKEPLMKKITPLSIIEHQNRKPSPKPVVSQSPTLPRQLDSVSFTASIDKSLEMESGSRSRLQLKPATSPKLRVEQYCIIVDTPPYFHPFSRTDWIFFYFPTRTHPFFA